MGVADNFVGANLATKIAFFLILLADVVNWIAFCTSSWYVESKDTTWVGLWRRCTVQGCPIQLDGSPDDDIDAVQAFAIFGFIALNVGLLLIVLYMFWEGCKGNAETGIASAIVLYISASTWLISVAIYGAKLDDVGGRFGYSFALAVCALILALFGGILMTIGGKGH
ncbi:unnamed protein product [Lymnaea stagnalis]|uniref:Uncharacterized protein n=1 Tax=Lymnaea stagnalis TaxID=6523 RepID=A0AAV2IRD2_LYMST